MDSVNITSNKCEKKTCDVVESYRNTFCFLISTLVSLNIGYYYFVDSNSLSFSWPFLYLYFLFDLPFSSLDIKIHHVFGLCLLSSIYLLHIPICDFTFILLPIYKTEMSTLFLVFKLWNKDNYLVKRFHLPASLFLINNMLFFTLFVKFRLVDYYRQIIIHPNTYSIVNTYSKNNRFGGYLAYSGIFGLVALNSYWFCIMCKILFKGFIQKYNKKCVNLLAEKLLSYTYFANIFIAGYNYSFSPHPSNIYDMFGILTLSVYSYKYHNQTYRFLLKNDDRGSEKIVADEILPYYMKDQLAIHFRAFLCMLTSGGFDLQTRYILHSSEILSAILHSSFFLSTCLYIYYHKNRRSTSNEPLVLKILISLPMLYDTYIVIMNSSDFVSSISLITITWLITLTLKTAPFYEMNHFAFHLLLMCQTYCLSRCNSERIINPIPLLMQ